MKFSVCVDAVFSGKDVYESIELLAKHGLKNIEFWSWWDKDTDRLLKLKEEWGLTYTAFCSRFVSLVDPLVRQEYVEGFRQTCETAAKLGCKTIITKPLDKTQASFEEQYQTMKETLEICLKIAEAFDVTIVLEPVNSAYEAPDTFMDHSALAFAFVDDIRSDHLKVLYDIYHMQIDEGNVLRRILGNISRIGHIHTAGSWERHELKDGELNYDYIFRKLEEAGYEGYVGLEYFPAEDPVTGLLEVTQKCYCI